jgi:hypothetical protein
MSGWLIITDPRVIARKTLAPANRTTGSGCFETVLLADSPCFSPETPPPQSL